MGTRPVFPSSGVLSAAIFAFGLAASSPSQASGPLLPLPLFNTGVDSTGAILPGGSVDPHFTLVASPDPAFPGPNAIVTSAIAAGYWAANGPNSKWIAPTALQDFPPTGPCVLGGEYKYRTTLDLAGFDPTTVSVTGGWMTDNSGTALRLNGVATGIVSSSYSSFTSFTLSSGFVAGTNTIDFVVNDFGCPTGLRVELSGTAASSYGVDTTPDPFSFPSRIGVILYQTQVSDVVTPTGYDAPAPISVVNGQYALGCNFSTTTADPGTINPGQSVCVLHNASGVDGESVTTTLTIGGVDGTFTSTASASAGISLSPASLAFGNQMMGTTSAGQVATVANSSSSGAFFSWSISGEFSISSTTCVLPLAGNSSCTFTLAFTPTVPGARTGTLLVQNGAGTQTVGLAGIGMDPNAAPDPFSFPSKSFVPTRTTVTSDAVTPAGYTATAPISVANGEFSIGCSLSFTATPGTINPGQSVCVRHMSAIDIGTPVITTLTIGGVNATFRSTTGGPNAIPQTIDFQPLDDRQLGDKPFAIRATSAEGSGNSIVFRSRSTSICTVTGSTVTLVSGGVCVIGANQAGDSAFSAAPEVTQGFTVAKASQSIIFGAIADHALGSGSFGVTASSTSLLAVTLSALTPAICDVSASTVTLIAAGTCTLAANQAGNANFNAAQEIRRTFAVNLVYLGIAKITAGDAHACALTTGGGVKCWGGNNLGQLGDNSFETRLGAVNVPGLTSGVAAIAAGSYSTCALTTSGGVKCWGSVLRTDFYGELVDFIARTPEDVPGLTSGVSAIAVGAQHACALMTGGGVKCWGFNSVGQLGSGNDPNEESAPASATPVDVAGLTSGVTRIAAGGMHTCALTTAGSVKCWGTDADGGWGRFEYPPATGIPSTIAGLSSGVAAIDAGSHHNCAVTTLGGAKCWGNDEFGQLGDNTDRFGITGVVDVVGLSSGVAAIAAGFDHTCAVTTGGGVKCWGSNVYGQLGVVAGTTWNDWVAGAFSATALDVPALASGVTAIAAGADFTCALTSGGVAKCWGYNEDGQLGNNTNVSSIAPVEVQERMDNTPALLSFVAQAGVYIDSVRTSNTITPTSYTSPAVVEISGGEYSVGCTGTFTAVTGNISPGQSVCVRHTASGSYSTSVTTTLTIGGIVGTFVSTTATPASLQLSTVSLSFGNQAVGTASAGQVITLSNPGGHPANAAGWGVNGDFSITSTGCIPTIVPGGSCTLTIAFSPLSMGGRTGDLQVFSANSVPATMHVPLFGTGSYSDTTPDAFSFVDRYLVPTNSEVTSDPVQITGLSAPAPITVIGGLYAVSSTKSCDGDVQNFTANPGMIANGQAVCVQHTASAVPGGSNDTQLIVGGLGDTFTSVTIDPVPAPFAFAPLANVTRLAQQVSAAVVISGINTPSPVAVAGGEYSIGCTGAFTQAVTNIVNGQPVCVRHVSSASFGASVATTLTIGGVSATFTSTTAGNVVAAVDQRDDFDGDGRSDILWRNDATGEVYVWLGSGTAFAAHSLGTVSLDWTIVGTGDINGDGAADILWRNTVTGLVYVWLMNGSSFTPTPIDSVPLNWQIAGFNDFDGDGRADILWRETTTGEVYVWFMNGTTLVQARSLGTIPLNFSIVATGDTNADGKADILWRDTTTGAVYLWLMNGTTFTPTYLDIVGLNWQIVGLADFNGDSRADILWRETSSGQVNIWYLNGSTLTQYLSLGAVPSEWEIRGLGSYGADPRADILWRNASTGQVYLWTTTGAGTFIGQSVGDVPAPWSIEGP